MYKFACRMALDDLEPFLVACFDDIQKTDHEMRERAKKAHIQFPFGWLYRAPQAFTQCLEERLAIPLCILACFAVVLKRTSDTWPVEGWPEHMMSGIHKWVPREYAYLLLWPMEA
ncbi:hypothetical protein BDP81DRAFT_104167 [Colletotrichum phormii]|uniref:Uncharacterized protein n=1 Tax=Colletotrichum phormii TaxID=359342 RepID=A0AAJ0EBE4_9PEZI|nr:uncharacterized protein BDP81DRAFT_104167 [Colletotrichum phormii]KAK1624990.1 hypothetical protein BDP81DRAFT_104167 [Colletotrichum phormii]